MHKERKKVLEAQSEAEKQSCTCTFMPEPYVNISRACSLKVLQRLHREKLENINVSHCPASCC